jgi:hypothetical protein
MAHEMSEEERVKLEEIYGKCKKIIQFKVTNCKVAKLYCWKRNI